MNSQLQIQMIMIIFLLMFCTISLFSSNNLKNNFHKNNDRSNVIEEKWNITKEGLSDLDILNKNYYF